MSAPKTIRVQVTQADIDEATRRIARRKNPDLPTIEPYAACCPIACAMRRQDVTSQPRVFYSRAHVRRKLGPDQVCLDTYVLSYAAKLFVRRFDLINTRAMARPGTFVLRLEE